MWNFEKYELLCQEIVKYITGRYFDSFCNISIFVRNIQMILIMYNIDQLVLIFRDFQKAVYENYFGKIYMMSLLNSCQKILAEEYRGIFTEEFISCREEHLIIPKLKSKTMT